MPNNDWGSHFEGAERERYVQIADVLKQYWFDAQCEYLASRLVDDGFRLLTTEQYERLSDSG